MNPLTGRTSIFGSGFCARHVAKNLVSAGADIIVATRGGDEGFSSFISNEKTGGASVEVLTNTRLLSCNGAVGAYDLVLMKDGERISRAVSSVVIAEAEERKPNFSLYGLTPDPRVLSLSRLLETDGEAPFPDVKNTVFLTGLADESNPVIVREIMELCLMLQTHMNLQTYVMTGNLKVAADGLETLYRKTKEAGTVYIKFTASQPEIRQDENTGIRIAFTDEITGKKFMLIPDLVIVDETIFPPAYAQELAKIFKLAPDPNRFLQTDNVHRLTVTTNRKGILVAGPSRSIQAPGDQISDARNAAAAVLALAAGDKPAHDDRAQIDTGLCVRCLTCYRVCPFRAIHLKTRLSVHTQACERCGICAAECPKGAIRIPGLASGEIAARIEADNQTESGNQTEAFVPFIVAFCCNRSAAEASKFASHMGHELPDRLNIIEVPCSGSISHDYIYKAFKKNADGVLVLTCHEGNCHSEHGNIYAGRRADHMAESFSRIGFEKERLQVQTLASNMGKEFAEIVCSFEKAILNLGPSRLKE